MSIADVTEDAILNLVFSATTWANYAINASASPETNIVVSLHTADPGDAGTGSTSESAYTYYVRVNVARSTGWSTSSAGAGSVSPVANIDFASSGAAGTTITHFATGKSGGGASALLWSGTVTPNIATGAAGITPRLTTASTITLA